MKSRDSISSHEVSNVRELEKYLSLRDRLFSLLAIRRGVLRLKRCLKLAILIVPLIALLVLGIRFVLEKAYGLNVEQIHFKSTRNSNKHREKCG